MAKRNRGVLTMSYAQRRAFGKADGDRLREQCRAVAKRLRLDTWELAECLFNIRTGLDAETGRRLVHVWGFGSFRHWAEAEAPVSRTASFRLTKLWERSQVLTTDEGVRARARDVSTRKLEPVADLLDEANIPAWCDFVVAHKHSEIQGARAVAISIPTLRQDPEKALARFNRRTFKASPGSKTITLSVTAKSQVAIDLTVTIMRRALKHPTLSAEQCVLKALEQFVRLAQSDRAGAGYALPPIELAETGT